MGGNTEMVRKLGSSRFNYWFGYVANAAWVLWLASHGWPMGLTPMSWSQFVGLFVVGLGLWTFCEYVLHRYLYHVIPSFLSQGHALHHDRPKELIGVPWWLTSVAVYGIFVGLCRLFAPGNVGTLFAGCWTGYIGYCLVHHGSHHWAMRRGYLRRVKRLHQLHHVYEDKNWGFTTHIWDVLFGTYLSPAAAAARTSANRRTRAGRPAARQQDLPGAQMIS